MSFALVRQFKRNCFEGLALSLSFGWLVRKTVYQLIPKVIPSNNWRSAHPVFFFSKYRPTQLILNLSRIFQENFFYISTYKLLKFLQTLTDCYSTH